MFSDGNQSPNTILGRVCISARKKLQFQLQRHSEDPTRVNLWPWKGLGRVLNIYLGFIDCTLEHLTFFASNSWLSNRKLNMQPAVSWDGRGSMQNHSWGRCPVLVRPFPSRLSVPEQVMCCIPRTVKRLPPLEPLAPAQKVKRGLKVGMDQMAPSCLSFSLSVNQASGPVEAATKILKSTWSLSLHWLPNPRGNRSSFNHSGCLFSR